MEDTFQIYLFQLNRITCWIKYLFILGFTAYFLQFIFVVFFLAFDISLGKVGDLELICYLLLSTFFVYVIIILFLSRKKKAWSLEEKEKATEEMLKLNFNKYKLLADYNVSSELDFYWFSEEKIRKIRRDIVFGKYNQ